MQLKAFRDDNKMPSKGSIEAVAQAFDTIEAAISGYNSDMLHYSLAVLRHSMLSKDAAEHWHLPYPERTKDESYIELYGSEAVFNLDLEYESEKAIDVTAISHAFRQLREALNRYYTPDLDYCVEVLRNGLLWGFYSRDDEHPCLSKAELKKWRRHIDGMKRTED